MKSYLKIYLAICFSLLFCNSFAQQLKSDLVKMQNTYRNAKSFSINVQLLLFENASDVKPLNSFSGSVKMDGSNYFNEIMGQTFIKNSNYIVSVDHNAKRIIYKEVSKYSTSANMLSLSIDSLLMRYKSAKFIKTADACLTYELIPNSFGAIYNKILITVDTTNYTLKSIVYFYTIKSTYQKAIINYSNIQLNIPISSSEFSEKSYININGSNASPGKACKGYKISKVNKNYTINL